MAGTVPTLDLHPDELASLCRVYEVETLDLFGSAVDGRFDSLRSDLDLIVRFKGDAVTSFRRHYFGFLARLETLYDRPIDLIPLGAIRETRGFQLDRTPYLRLFGPA